MQRPEEGMGSPTSEVISSCEQHEQGMGIKLWFPVLSTTKPSLSSLFFFPLSSQILSIVFDGCGMCYHCENGFFFLP